MYPVGHRELAVLLSKNIVRNAQSGWQALNERLTPGNSFADVLGSEEVYRTD